MLSLLGQAAAASRKATSAGVGASMVTSFARSAHMIATPRAAATTTKSSFETTPAILSSIILRVEPPLPQIPNQVRDRQDRQQPDQDERNLPGHAFREQRGEKAEYGA